MPLYPQTASISLNVAIIGAGVAGLATAHCLANAGHRVTVFESARQMGEVGAGIHLSPNATRLMNRWGLRRKLEEVCVEIEGMSFYSWQTGEKIQTVPIGALWEKLYGSRYYAIHRADLHSILHELAAPSMNLRLNSKVVSIDSSTPSLTLHTGEVVKVDLIIGADGVKSVVRGNIVPDSLPMATGDAAYRATIPTAEMLRHPDLAELLARTETSDWMGPGKHIIAYPIRSKKEYNLLMLHPDNGSSESWTKQVASNEDMIKDFAGWEPRVEKLLSMITSMLNWTLIDIAPLNNCVHKDGKVTLVGDACHAMLPYRAQGAAMALEDAAVLGNLLSRLTSRVQLKPLLQAYKDIRHARTTAAQLDSRANQATAHFPDGPAQVARDDAMRKWSKQTDVEEGEGTEELKNMKGQMWGAEDVNLVQYSYDADEEVERWWKEGGRGITELCNA